MAVPSQDVFARELDLNVGQANVGMQAYYTWERPTARYRTNFAIVIFNNNFSFTQEEKDDSLLNSADTNWFITLV